MTPPPLSEEQIFKTALEIVSPIARQAWLEQACGDDDDLRQRVVALLKVAEDEPGFLETSPAGSPPPAGLMLEQPGTQIGPYKLIEQIGEGGFGVVFVAEQQTPVRRIVALKVLKPGMDTRQVIARFEAERQALALMDHPHIAKVLDAGTTASGRPFFVMELVRGVPITRFCDERRLTPRQRLELFVPVCQAIQHAHQKGVIHRDIKPSNVLVALYDERAVPKVIDFGVAKALDRPLTDKTLITNFGALVGTLEYMSPEQASFNNLDVDTRSDVYSLGVLLYELLTGETPVDRSQLRQGALLEMLRIVREVEAPPPSARLSTLASAASIAANRSMEPARLTESLKGELDWVLLKALEKDRTRRYETASALARDIERYLADELIEARPPSAGYRLRKFARQHRAALGTAGVVSLCLVLGVAVSTWLAVRASRAQQWAVNAAREALAAQTESEEVRVIAEEQRQVALAERVISDRQRELALAEQATARQNLVTSQLLLGQIANSNGDTAGALTWYLQGYRNTSADDPRRITARNLIGAWGGSLQQTLVHDAGVHTVAVSADGRKLLAGYYHGRVQVWDLATGLPQGEPLPHAGDIVSAQLSADGRFALIGDWEGARVWDLAIGQEKYPPLEHKVREDTVLGPVLSPDGQSIVTRSPFTGIRLWDAETGQPRGESLPLGPFVSELLFSPDSRRVAALGGGVARVWDVATAQPVGEQFTGMTGLAFHPAGRIAAISQQDGKVVLHDLKAHQPVAELLHDKPVVSVQFDKSGNRLVTRDAEQAYLWLNVLDDQRTRQVLPHGRSLFAALLSPTGDWVLTASPLLLRVWNAGTETPVWERSVPQDLTRARSDRVKHVVLSPDGQSLFTLSDNDTAEVLSTSHGRRLVRETNVARATFTADGKTLIVAGRDGWARLRAIDTGDGRRLSPRIPREICAGHVSALSPDGTLLFVVGEKRSGIFRTDTLEPVGQPLEGLYHDWKDAVSSAAFSFDNRLLVTAMSLRGPGNTTQSTGRVDFWDVTTASRIGEPLVTPRAPLGISFDATGTNVRIGEFVFDPATRLAREFAGDRIPPGRRTVASVLGMDDMTSPELWDTALNLPTTVPVPVHDVRLALISPDGRRVLIVKTDGRSQLHDATTGEPIGPAFTAEGYPRARSPEGRYTVFTTLNSLRIWDGLTGRPCGDNLQQEMANATAAFSPEGTRLATNWHFKVQLWDTATGLALGPPLSMPSNTAAHPNFTPDGRRLLIPGNGLTVWQVPPPALDDPERLQLSLEVRTGLEIGEQGTLQKLSHAAWLDRKRRLDESGGPCDVSTIPTASR